MRQLVARDIEHAEQLLLAGALQGLDAYHACATFLTEQGVWDVRKEKWIVRTPDNIAFVRCFWFDIDLGKKGGYETLEDAARAVEAFCRAVGLPSPSYVVSGGGLHVYWSLRVAIKYVEWHPIATELKAVALAYGLKIDPSRTADGASILRPPETKNYKYDPPRLVTLGELAGPFDLEQIKVVCNVKLSNGQAGTVSHPKTAIATGNGKPVESDRGRTKTLARAASAIYGSRECSLDLIARHCAQVSRFATAPHEPDEPDLYNIIGLAGYCSDAAPILRRIAEARKSAGRRYGSDAEHYQKKWKQWQAQAGAPTTCKQFEATNPDGCRGCALKGAITSPIVKGYGKRDSNETTHTANPVHVPTNGSTDPATGAVTWYSYRINGEIIQLPALPEGYAFNPQGQVCLIDEDKNGQRFFTLIHDKPFFLDAEQHSEVTGNHSLCFNMYQAQEKIKWKAITLEAGQLGSANGLQELGKQGMNIHDAGKFHTLVRKMRDDYSKRAATMIQYDQFGWKDNDQAFLYGQNLYTCTKIIPAVGGPDVRARINAGMHIAEGASLNEWATNANKLFGHGSEPHAVILLAGFAAPMVRFLRIHEGGTIVHGENPATGTSKTLSAQASCSIWGQWEAGQISKIDTDLSYPMMLGTFSNLPVYYDEIKYNDPKAILSFVEMFTNGRDRKRVSKDGTHTVQRATVWQTLLISMDNRSLIQILSHVKGSKAMTARILEMYMTKLDMDIRYGRRLVDKMLMNAGVAGDYFLKHLMVPQVYEDAVNYVNGFADELISLTPDAHEQRFRIYAAAAIIAAAKFTSGWGLLNFDPQRISDFLQKIFIRNANLLDPEMSPQEALANYLNARIKETLIVKEAWHNSSSNCMVIEPPRGELLVRVERDSHEISFRLGDFHGWLTDSGLSVKDVIQKLKDDGILKEANKFVSLGAGTNWRGAGQSRCHVVDSRALNRADDSPRLIADSPSLIQQAVGGIQASGQVLPFSKRDHRPEPASSKFDQSPAVSPAATTLDRPDSEAGL